MSTPVGIIRVLNAKYRTRSWTESIAQKVKRRKKVEDNSRKEIWHSVFAPEVAPVFVDESPVRLPARTMCRALLTPLPRSRRSTTSPL